jgi:uncharacterized protein YjbI with pentapeptide repeats
MPNSTFKKARTRISDRQQWPRSWWYPVPPEDTLHREVIRQLHESHAKTINKTMFALLGVGLYCLLKVFGESDKSLIVANTTVQTPLVGTSISFQGFLIVAPLLLVILTVYLHIVYGHWLQLERMRVDENKKILDKNNRLTGTDEPEATIVSIPALFSFPERLPRLFTNLVFYWFVPITLWIMAYKAFALKEFIFPFSFFASVITLLLLFLQINRCPDSKSEFKSKSKPKSKRWFWNLPRWVLFGLLAAFTVNLPSFSESFRRPLDLQREDLHGARLQGLDMAGANMNNANLQGANLSEANLQSTNLQNANLQGAHLSQAFLQKARLDGANLQQADLRNAKLQGAKLEKANLQGATLVGADFEEADLPSANLQGATLDMSTTNFQSADLAYVNFREITEENLSHIRYAKNWEDAFFSKKHLAMLKLPPTHNEDVESIRELTNDLRKHLDDYRDFLEEKNRFNFFISDFEEALSATPYKRWEAQIKSLLTKLMDECQQKKLKIGDEYGGGKIAYIFPPNDKGYNKGTQHGLIAAREDINTTYIVAGNKTPVIGFYHWSSGGTEFKIMSDSAKQKLLNTSTRIGEGEANTNNILKKYNAATFPNTAAAVARAYRGGGYTDWFLPSKSELNKLYLNRSAVGGFAFYFYWSSSADYEKDVWFQYFGNGNQYSIQPSDSQWRVRPVRYF